MENLAIAISTEEQETKMTAESKILRENFQKFGVATFLFACFYTFCMYKNESGVTYFFMVAAGLVYARYCGKQLELSAKKGNLFHIISILLLGISTFSTDDARIIMFNKSGVFLLMLSMVLYNLFETTKWGPGKYLVVMIQSVLWSLGEWMYPFRDANKVL